MKVVHFGAGNIGRGFIGTILSSNNYELVFVDVNKVIIDALNASDSYNVKYLSDKKDDVVSNFRAINSNENLEDVIKEIRTADLITTSLGQENLKYVVKTIYDGIEKRYKSNINEKIDIIACENGVKVTSVLKKQIEELYTDDNKNYFTKNVGYVDCTVDRIVPNQTNDNMCDVKVEESFEWVFDKNQVKKNFDIVGVDYADELSYYNKRKLLTVNFTHSLIGYVGYNKNYKYVHESLKDKDIYLIVKNALNDINTALILEFNVDLDKQQQYGEKTLSRFENELLNDEVTRVARNPYTKLGYNERYVSPLRILDDNNKDYNGIATAIAYALSYNEEKDDEAMKIQEMIKNTGIEKTISDITELENVDIIKNIINEYEKITINQK